MTVVSQAADLLIMRDKKIQV